ncbi:MAG: hypothetical protein AAFP99_04125 [Pseudomonadota bacterium]
MPQWLFRNLVFAVLGVILGAAAAYFFGEWLGLNSVVSAAIGGGIAGFVAGEVRRRTGLDT